MITRVLLLASLACALPAVTAAQATAPDTRSGAITAAQAEKATRLAPYEPNRVEQVLVNLRGALIEQPAGFYPYFASVYSGGGFTLGAGYRNFTGDRSQWSLAGLYSVKAYKSIELALTSPGHLGGHLDVRAMASWMDATQVSYHGLGINSPADVDTAFRMQRTVVGGAATARLRRWLLLTGAATVEDYSLKDPTGEHTSVEDAYTPESAPGLGVDPTYLHTTAALAFDSRPAADYARHGGLYSVAVHQYSDRDTTYSFNRLDSEIVQHIPVLRENWVFSLRGRLQTTLSDDDQVPYFLLPSLGSGSTLRGYSSWRFRDRHSMLVSGEWRWIPSRLALDMALFYDTGMVAPRLNDIALNSFVSDFGVGVRFHAPTRTPLRIELAKSDEGTRVVFSASSAF